MPISENYVLVHERRLSPATVQLAGSFLSYPLTGLVPVRISNIGLEKSVNLKINLVGKGSGC